MSERLTDEELEEIRERRDEARDGEYHDSTVYAVEGRERLLDEVERLRGQCNAADHRAKHKAADLLEMEVERDRLTDITRQMGRWLFSSQGANVIAGERARQIDEEGYTPDFDDQHTEGELVRAAACYALHAAGWEDTAKQHWPMDWGDGSFNPGDNPTEALAKAGALIAAEIDRLHRKELSECCGAAVAVEGSWYVCHECGEAVLEELTND